MEVGQKIHFFFIGGLMRIGQGYDVHQLADNRKLILGGVEIPYEKGLLGHSDADVLIHAIIDAILGALALGDIGKLFPDTSQNYKDIDSRILLKKVYELMDQHEYVISNLDATICAQKPKLSDYIDKMRSNLAQDLNCSLNEISIKATTEEHLGISGSEKGMTAYAVVLLKSK